MSDDFVVSSVDKQGSIAVMRIAGRLEARSAQEFWKRCREVRERGTLHLVVNLSGVTFVASSGIGTILALTEEFGEVGGSIGFVEVPGAVRSVLEAMNLTQFLRLAGSEAEAVEMVGA